MMIKTLPKQELTANNICVKFFNVEHKTEFAILLNLINGEGKPAGIWLPKKVLANFNSELDYVWVWKVFYDDMAKEEQVRLIDLNTVNTDEAVRNMNELFDRNFRSNNAPQGDNN